MHCSQRGDCAVALVTTVINGASVSGTFADQRAEIRFRFIPPVAREKSTDFSRRAFGAIIEFREPTMGIESVSRTLTPRLRRSSDFPRRQRFRRVGHECFRMFVCHVADEQDRKHFKFYDDRAS